MKVVITGNYIRQCLDLLKLWDTTHRFFKVGKMQKLVGKLTRLDEAVPWISKLMSHLYTSLAFAHQSNAELLKETSSSFCKIIKQIKTKNFSCKPFELCNEESCKDDQQERAPLSNQRNYGRGIKFHFASLVT